MAKFIRLVIHANLPEELQPLDPIARNLRWCWDHEAIDLFRRIDPDLWEEVGHNPIRLLGEVKQRILVRLAGDDAFLAHMERVSERLRRYLEHQDTWYARVQKNDGGNDGPEWVAYFSMEFGLAESLPIYSGGLGVLAGDFLKSNSDLGIPLVGVGLLYQQGYFQQYLNSDGWQQEEYPDLSFTELPIRPAASPEDGGPVVVQVPLPGRQLQARVWEAAVGRVRLFLLDTNIEQNLPEDRTISFKLYGGDRELRLRQEILLGIGGVRALVAMGREVDVFHMNEGHSAFLSLERIRRLMVGGKLTFAEAREAVRATSVFTTHTPVPAGNDYFEPGLITRYLADYAGEMGLELEELMGLGRLDPANQGERFCMTVLALKCSAHRNAVSRLHGVVSREMWRGLWPEHEAEEVPIGHVTNGVHLGTWVNKDLSSLFDSYLGPAWREDLPHPEVWERIRAIPNIEIWRSHERRRERLVGFARQRLAEYYHKRGASAATISDVTEVLDSRVLTIGFARRFATYKRADLLFSDPDRLARILGNRERPVQIIFAGKAHPRDDAGKKLIQRIMHFARETRFWSRIVFLENYDMNTARRLVQGCDIWLNLPRRPMEASGTSGMKAVFNGALHLSVLDGWWAEAWRPGLGWAVGRGEVYAGPEIQDRVEASALYDLLERDVVPLFYDLSDTGIPRGWVEMMKESMATLIPTFSTARMVEEYLVHFYKPAASLVHQLSRDSYQGARELAGFRQRVESTWDKVKVEEVLCRAGALPRVGEHFAVEANMDLGGLKPEEVTVEAIYGPLDPHGRFREKYSLLLEPGEKRSPRLTTFGGRIEARWSGPFGVKVMVTPNHPLLCDRKGWGFVQ